jgi:hypothetical protein
MSTNHGSRPWPALLDFATFQDAVDQRWHVPLISKLSKQAGDVLEPDDEGRGKIDARDQNQ